MVTDHFDTLETRAPAIREAALLTRLPAQIAYAKAYAPAFSRLFADIDPVTVNSRAALAKLPVTRKSSLVALQQKAPPFGGFAAQDDAAKPVAGVRRVFASPGPLYEPEGGAADYWRFARALFAAGFRSGELIHNCFSYHFTPAGSMLDAGAHALGCVVFPGGTGQTEQQVQAMAALRPAGYVGTPSFLKIILDKALELNIDLSILRKALVSGEAFPPSLREALGARGIECFEAYATADLGTIAYETAAHAGLIVDEGVLVEIVRPGTDDPVPLGEVGEVVVTTLTNTTYPLIRFGTGDLSKILPGESACGRTNTRIHGWLGRADQTTKVKGMFVHPGQIDAIVKRHPEVLRARLVVENSDNEDRMTLHVEVADRETPRPDALIASLREITKLRGEVVFHAPGELANDGKIIDDRRTFR